MQDLVGASISSRMLFCDYAILGLTLRDVGLQAVSGRMFIWCGSLEDARIHRCAVEGSFCYTPICTRVRVSRAAAGSLLLARSCQNLK